MNRKEKKVKATCTVQFRIKDIGFFNNSFAIDKYTAGQEELLNATSATLRLGNQKNGKMGQCIHHHAAIPDVAWGPTQALA